MVPGRAAAEEEEGEEGDDEEGITALVCRMSEFTYIITAHIGNYDTLHTCVQALLDGLVLGDEEDEEQVGRGIDDDDDDDALTATTLAIDNGN